MTFHDFTASSAISQFNSNAFQGLNKSGVNLSRAKYGENLLTKKKPPTLVEKIFSALKEPMLIILMFGFILTFGTNLGKLLKTGEGDFSECVGILFAVILSVSITLIMEGSSEKAFNALNKIYDNLTVKVIRDGVIVFLPQRQVVVGDIILIESGDKIVADGRLIESNQLSVDESSLTGESAPLKKNADVVLGASTPLAERANCVYSGTFVSSGNGKMLVTAIGDKTEIGLVAKELGGEAVSSPLQQKLGKLGKTISIIGAVTAGVVFLISAIRLALIGALDFSSVQELFISSIVLIIAAVPEGLPTIVAVSLALNMLKLAKENALIKKMSATETTGAVSVICSDKTGTITENKMSVISVCRNQFCSIPEKLTDKILFQNFICNSTANITVKNKRIIDSGNATECALLRAYYKANSKIPYTEIRTLYPLIDRLPFSSEHKFMSSTILIEDKKRTLIKGAPEVIVSKCTLTDAQKGKVFADIKFHQSKARRVICFAHADETDFDGELKFIYDGFAVIKDPIRKEVFKAVDECKKAGIKVKILTGDNFETALAIAQELKIANDESQVISAKEIENLNENELKKALSKITVIARSTPIVKLRVVKALKSMGEVVAVTGDGINDAPAIKHADVGIAMGINGSDITKESADIVLLDDSFATVIKAVSFGRNVYKNLQRFILFQLSVNFSALFFVTVCAVLGMNAPFNTLQLLWINIIMDGPPALTLGLERASDDLMSNAPIKRNVGIVSKSMLYRIIFNGLFVGIVMSVQYVFDFLNVGITQARGATFTLFILFQLFNAFNSRELGAKSIFNGIGKNKIMVFTFGAVFLAHFIIVQFCPTVFGVNPLTASTWIKTLLTASSMVIVSELFKLFYRLINGTATKKYRKIAKA